MTDLVPPRLIPKKPLTRSRALRRNSTEAEKQLWSVLQNRKLDGWKFRRQAAIGSFIVDFCCIQARLIVELDGEQHADARKRYDDARTLELQARGFRVLRFWNSEVSQGAEGVAEEISRILNEDKSVTAVVSRHNLPQNPHLPAAGRPASSPVK
jgi:very-short-patch-repair endonuclease